VSFLLIIQGLTQWGGSGDAKDLNGEDLTSGWIKCSELEEVTYPRRIDELEAVQYHLFAPENVEDLTAGWNECTTLEKVMYPDSIGLRHIQALVHTPKCSLKTIHLTFADDSTQVKKSIDALANAWITSLETVEIHCPVPPSNTFNLLAERNKPLRNISIWLPDLNEVEDDKYLESLMNYAYSQQSYNSLGSSESIYFLYSSI